MENIVFVEGKIINMKNVKYIDRDNWNRKMFIHFVDGSKLTFTFEDEEKLDDTFFKLLVALKPIIISDNQ